jgi:hypothetical protein
MIMKKPEYIAACFICVLRPTGHGSMMNYRATPNLTLIFTGQADPWRVADLVSWSITPSAPNSLRKALLFLDCRPHLLSSLSKMDDVTTSNTFSKGYG